MSTEKKLCKVKIFQLQSMSNAIRCIRIVSIKGLRSRILAYRAWPWYSSWNSKNAVLQRRVINHFLARDQYERMAQRLRHLPVSQATWNGFSQGAETPCRPLAILRGTEPVSALTRALLYCCVLYKKKILGFCQWRSRADRVVNHPTSTVLENLNSGPCQLSPTCASTSPVPGRDSENTSYKIFFQFTTCQYSRHLLKQKITTMEIKKL